MKLLGYLIFEDKVIGISWPINYKFVKDIKQKHIL
jgi:hypothetical protein